LDVTREFRGLSGHGDEINSQRRCHKKKHFVTLSSKLELELIE
jgi:hypothetical protein